MCPKHCVQGEKSESDRLRSTHIARNNVLKQIMLWNAFGESENFQRFCGNMSFRLYFHFFLFSILHLFLKEAEVVSK